MDDTRLAFTRRGYPDVDRKTCADCGTVYYSAGAHLERCPGVGEPVLSATEYRLLQTAGVGVTGRERPKPWLTLLTPPNPYSKSGARTIVIARRPYRSKWWTLTCFCKRARKDGTCLTLDGVIPLLAHPERTRFEHEAKVRS